MVEDRDRVKKSVGAHFRTHAFHLNKDALEYAVDRLVGFDKEKRSRWMEKLIEGLRKQNLASSMVDVRAMKDVVSSVTTARVESAPLMQVIAATDVPQWKITSDGKTVVSIKKDIRGHVTQATEALRQRMLLLSHRIRHHHKMQGCQPTPVEALLSSPPGDHDVVVLGMLVKNQENRYSLEDLTGTLPIDIALEDTATREATTFHAGVFTVGEIMLMEGRWDGAEFLVSAIGLVPDEPSSETRSVIGNVNWFGGTEKVAASACPSLIAMEARHPDACIVLLSDVHLDNHKTMDALESLLQGFSSMPPAAIVLCGNFCSRFLQADTAESVKTGMKKLADMIKRYSSTLGSTQFVFVPGQEDPGLPLILPRPPIPTALRESFANLKNCTFTTNPARIMFASQEIVIFRHDTVERLCKNALHVTEKLDELTDQVARTIISNGHLCPLPREVQPVLWPLDCALRLLPSPDTLILADRFGQYTSEQSGCLVANPGPFGRLGYDFLVYYPFRRNINERMEGSSID